MTTLFGSIEGGGTKFVCAVGNEKNQIIDQLVIPTTTPTETLEQVITFFKKFDIQAFGIASFGPIDIHPHSETYGYILATPKISWKNFDFVGTFKQAFPVPIFWTTDVNASAYGEWVALQDQQLTSCVYFTVGTGIGGSVIQNGEFIGGTSHLELGHTYIKRHELDQEFAGNCPYHHDCLEGLAAGPSIQKRTGTSGEALSENDPVWTIIAFYIAQTAYNTTVSFAPDRIIFGGGVMAQDHLMQRVRAEFLKLNNQYLTTPAVEKYLVHPVIPNNGSATFGNFALAAKALAKK